MILIVNSIIFISNALNSNKVREMKNNIISYQNIKKNKYPLRIYLWLDLCKQIAINLFLDMVSILTVPFTLHIANLK